MKQDAWRVHGSIMRFKGATQRLNSMMLRPNNLYLVESWQNTPVAYVARIDGNVFVSYADYDAFLKDWSERFNDFDL